MRREDLSVLRDKLSTAVRKAAETGASTPEIVAAFRRNNKPFIDMVATSLIDMALARLVGDVAKRRRAGKRLAPGQTDLFGVRLGELLTVPPDGRSRATHWRRFGSLKHSFAKSVVQSHLETRRRQDKFNDFDEILTLSEPFAKPGMSVDEAYALYLESKAAGGPPP